MGVRAESRRYSILGTEPFKGFASATSTMFSRFAPRCRRESLEDRGNVTAWVIGSVLADVTA
jgi:hypothetical protein